MADSVNKRDNRLRRNVSKLINRNTEKVLRTFGVGEETKDEIIDNYVHLVTKQQIQFHKFQRDIKLYLQSIIAMKNATEALYNSMSEVYDDDWLGKDMLASLAKTTELLHSDLHSRLNTEVIAAIQDHLNQCNEMKVKAGKRGRKLVDFDASRRALHALQGSKKLEESKLSKARDQVTQAHETYEQINGQLHEELPDLYDSRVVLATDVISSVANAEKSFYSELAEVQSKLLHVLSNVRDAYDNGDYRIQRLHSSVINTAQRKTDPHPEAPATLPADEVSSRSRAHSEKSDDRSHKSRSRGSASSSHDRHGSASPHKHSRHGSSSSHRQGSSHSRHSHSSRTKGDRAVEPDEKKAKTTKINNDYVNIEVGVASAIVEDEDQKPSDVSDNEAFKQENVKERAVEPQAPASLSVDAGDVPKPSPRAHSRHPHSSSVDRSNVTVNEKVPPSPRPRTLNPLATAPQFEENKSDMSEVGPEEKPGPSVLYRQTKETSPTEQTDEIESSTKRRSFLGKFFSLNRSSKPPIEESVQEQNVVSPTKKRGGFFTLKRKKRSQSVENIHLDANKHKQISSAITDPDTPESQFACTEAVFEKMPSDAIESDVSDTEQTHSVGQVDDEAIAAPFEDQQDHLHGIDVVEENEELKQTTESSSFKEEADAAEFGRLSLVVDPLGGSLIMESTMGESDAVVDGDNIRDVGIGRTSAGSMSSSLASMIKDTANIAISVSCDDNADSKFGDCEDEPDGKLDDGLIKPAPNSQGCSAAHPEELFSVVAEESTATEQENVYLQMDAFACKPAKKDKSQPVNVSGEDSTDNSLQLQAEMVSQSHNVMLGSLDLTTTNLLPSENFDDAKRYSNVADDDSITISSTVNSSVSDIDLKSVDFGSTESLSKFAESVMGKHFLETDVVIPDSTFNDDIVLSKDSPTINDKSISYNPDEIYNMAEEPQAEDHNSQGSVEKPDPALNTSNKVDEHGTDDIYDVAVNARPIADALSPSPSAERVDHPKRHDSAEEAQDICQVAKEISISEKEHIQGNFGDCLPEDIYDVSIVSRLGSITLVDKAMHLTDPEIHFKDSSLHANPTPDDVQNEEDVYEEVTSHVRPYVNISKKQSSASNGSQSVDRGSSTLHDFETNDVYEDMTLPVHQHTNISYKQHLNEDGYRPVHVNTFTHNCVAAEDVYEGMTTQGYSSESKIHLPEDVGDVDAVYDVSLSEKQAQNTQQNGVPHNSDEPSELIDKKKPSNEILPPHFLYKAIAQYPYKGSDEDELNFDKDDIIYVVEFPDPDEQDEGWQMGILQSSWKDTRDTSCMGVFPENFTKRLT
ncbi:uncharacterized protein LOC143464855 isoform X2 [Clavelina lepadiformis]|uniref:uncharacterized protein LOC143464855 isoform X2 n=1 Tax=Clavelina lepadiformis TaxID=159417 RepID=UPI0040434FF9